MGADYIDFFLGANTSKGFLSRYEQISKNPKIKKLYVIKGGAGTGKSTIMKKVAEEYHKRGFQIERIHCSSDPDSLDGVIVEEKGMAILDGTPPHVMEPQYPAAFETLVDLYPCWNEEILEKNIEQIKNVVKKYTDCHKRACDHISLISALLKGNNQVVRECVDYEKMDRYIKYITKKELGRKQDKTPTEKVRFFSAITPQGVKFYTSTIESLCDKIYVVEDEFGVVSDYMLRKIKESAAIKNLDVISGYCVIDPYDKLEQLIIPEKRIAFLTSNMFHKISTSTPRVTVKASRFTDTTKLSERKQYLSFNKKVVSSCLTEAVKEMKQAKTYHDLLESIYVSSVDFKKVDTLFAQLLEKMKKSGVL